MQAKRKSGNSCVENPVLLYHRIQSSKLNYVKVSKSLSILSLEYGKVKLLTIDGFKSSIIVDAEILSGTRHRAFGETVIQIVQEH